MKFTMYFNALKRVVLGSFFTVSPILLGQSVIFPQPQQPGEAILQTHPDRYTLKNELFTATFIKQNGSLFFGGCPELNLADGTELFEVKLGNGATTVKASQMQLGNIEVINYAANPNAVKGVKRFAGKALQATFTHQHLTFTWRAVLRDESHYLRTELEAQASQNTKMFALTPMIYHVDVQQAGSVPKVVGNTRGAVLLSEKIFAGLETPMGINTVGGNEIKALDSKVWTPLSFSWTPDTVPASIKALGFNTQHIKAIRGYLSFKQAGSQTITFTYSRGNNKLNIAGVEILDPIQNKTVSSDYHYGTTGNRHNKNSYNINIPQKGVYEVRYYVATYALTEKKTEPITASGTITYSGSVYTPILKYDLGPGSAPSLQKTQTTDKKATRALTNNVFEDGTIQKENWNISTWKQVAQSEVPLRIGELGHQHPNVWVYEQDVQLNTKGEFKAEFVHKTGDNRLNICGVDLINSEKQVVSSDYHNGFSGKNKERNVYSLAIATPGSYKIRCFVEFKTEKNTSSGDLFFSLVDTDILHLPSSPITPITGVWSRNTTLLKGETWKIGSVVGVVAPNQARRSFLAYSERERAVPWRAVPAYISWYELNIDRNNSPDYSETMTIEQCTDVVSQWKKNLFDKYGESINSFVWDDGWDFYGPWTFNKNFPNGFSEIDQVARQMNSGIGAWLGPVGGYGASGNYRRNYWKNKGGMQLSNPAYYKVFTQAITNLCNERGYDFRFFKFDGISDLFSATGPKSDANGEENAEGIIRAERMVREEIKEDIFFNTSVGTWASPFWFQYTDAIWRQENDYGEIGNQGTDREKWITYRDRLVYQNFVQNSPLCPINTLMTHGFILSRWGSVSKNMDYEGIVREMRCAFACGSGMVELYNDYSLMNSINGGRLWGDLAECLRWQKANADVLPDVHWIGGNPWDGTKANVYGWASWNGKKSTLALRNPATTPATYTTTLRAALEIPTHIMGSITLTKAFGNQTALQGINEDTPIDIDATLTLRLPGSSVFIFNGRESTIPAIETTSVTLSQKELQLQVGRSTTLVWNIHPLNATHTTVNWHSSNPNIATVNNGVVKGLKEGTTTITVTTTNNKTAQLQLTIVPYVPESYAVNFDKNERSRRNNRKLLSFGVTEQGKVAQTRKAYANRMPYQDHTTDTLTVSVSAVITPQLRWEGSYMHAYVYADLDHSQQFEVTNENSPELLCFSYYKNKKKDKDGIHTQSNKNPDMSHLPTFVAPSVPGVYRLRFKIDWDSVDPAGQVVTDNHILNNGGSITDIMLKVVKPTGIHSSLSGPSKTTSVYDLFGRKLKHPITPGVYLINGQKAIK